MDRALLPSLIAWAADGRGRKPLILHGARQVGKTWLVRELAAHIPRRELVEINFERDPRLAKCFAANDPNRILADLGLELDRRIDPRQVLLFLDEVQAAPSVLSSMRWFQEELQGLPVIAAGSLLDFALAGHEFSMPVGRVTYRYLEPLSFAEFLRAHRQDQLLDRLRSWRLGSELDATAHERSMTWYSRFAMVGGMPAAVEADVEKSEPSRVRDLQSDLLVTFRDDFAKYMRLLEPRILDVTLLAVARQLGAKFVYARADESLKQQQVKRALELLAMARVVTVVPHSAGNGVPLGGEAGERNKKAILLDVSLLHALLRTPAGASFPRLEDLTPPVRAQLAEQMTGQQIRCLPHGRGLEPSLYYWQRVGGRPGEVDFLVQVGTRIVPVEVKSGAAGSMKSLHQFVHDKRLDLAVRVDVNPPSLQDVDVKTTVGDPARYRLLNLPGYLLFRMEELILELEGSRARR